MVYRSNFIAQRIMDDGRRNDCLFGDLSIAFFGHAFTRLAQNTEARLRTILVSVMNVCPLISIANATKTNRTPKAEKSKAISTTKRERIVITSKVEIYFIYTPIYPFSQSNAKFYHIAVFDDIFLAFGAHETFFASGSIRAGSE